jgi:membrane associated rhomboid family serine protease
MPSSSPSPFSLTDEPDAPRVTPAVQWLIGINIVVFFLEKTVSPQGIIDLLGFRASTLTSEWWTVLTYMFVHGSFLLLAFNVVVLFFFGPRVERAWGAAPFVRYYLLCGLGGWLAHLMLASQSTLIGASAAIYGVMLAYAVRWPDDEVYVFFAVPVKIKWLVAILVVSSLVLGLTQNEGSGVAQFAHLGGFVAGWLYLHSPSSGSIRRLRQRVSQVPDVPDETPRAIPRSGPAPRSRERSDIDEIVARSKAAVVKRAQTPPPQAARETPRPGPTEELDVVLDKINRQGMESLTADERRILDEMSRRLRDG